MSAPALTWADSADRASPTNPSRLEVKRIVGWSPVASTIVEHIPLVTQDCDHEARPGVEVIRARTQAKRSNPFPRLREV